MILLIPPRMQSSQLFVQERRFLDIIPSILRGSRIPSAVFFLFHLRQRKVLIYCFTFRFITLFHHAWSETILLRFLLIFTLECNSICRATQNNQSLGTIHESTTDFQEISKQTETRFPVVCEIQFSRLSNELGKFTRQRGKSAFLSRRSFRITSNGSLVTWT